MKSKTGRSHESEGAAETPLHELPTAISAQRAVQPHVPALPAATRFLPGAVMLYGWRGEYQAAGWVGVIWDHTGREQHRTQPRQFFTECERDVLRWMAG